jgi:hypothetical protein
MRIIYPSQTGSVLKEAVFLIEILSPHIDSDPYKRNIDQPFRNIIPQPGITEVQHSYYNAEAYQKDEHGKEKIFRY